MRHLQPVKPFWPWEPTTTTAFSEKRFLGFKSMNFEVDTAAQKTVAEAIADIRPDRAFMLWPDDRSVPHQRAAELSKADLLFGNDLLNDT